MSYCSPNIKSNTTYTCFERTELEELAYALNTYIKKNKLCLLQNSKTCSTKIINIKNKPKRQLWESIYSKLKSICPSEHCWIDLEFIKEIPNLSIKEKIRNFTFKPKLSKDANSWLWTEDINRVLQQYQLVDKRFKFLGALPSDFYKLVKVDYSDICNYNKYSIVFNLDNHNQSGSHWVALLIDNISKTIEYYDSIGNLPNKNINYFIQKVKSYLYKTCKFKYSVLYNRNRQQYENIECGVYSIHFIITRLLGKSFTDISTAKILDKDMNRFRRIVFRPHNKLKIKHGKR